ncbi:MAG: DUF4091 domain-containing protein [Clostridia bacterium]|nr:DUF4091 domain-containing protein [Clostridia bacterium]
MFKAKIISSLQKCFIGDDPECKPALTSLTAYKNEKAAFQLCYRMEGVPSQFRGFAAINVDSAIPLSVRTVEQVPVLMPVFPTMCDDDYLSKTPGFYPDLLLPLHHGGTAVPVCEEETRCLWLQAEPGKNGLKAGEHEIKLTLSLSGEAIFTGSLTVTVIDAELPPSTLLYTQWFHCDCLASYYNVPVFSEKHWKIIENYARCAAENGMTMILTPVFTPPLDTHIGGERATVQLVEVKVTDGGYEFGFKKLKRWIRMCHRVGIYNFEISHLFTQWGAAHAPKIVADVGGAEKQIFGWDTDSTGEEYRGFLAAFIPALLGFLRAEGVDKNCRFHVSDEPSAQQLPVYREAKKGIAELLRGYPIMDALSSIEYYRDGVVEHPIPACDHIEPFYEAGVPDLWTYYCCGQHTGVPNRFIAMPSYRTRIIGFLFYKYDVKGFLQWGYNFYNNAGSYDPINPYISSACDYFGQAGDAFSVWPAQDGSPYESIRIRAFAEALDDLRALRLCESIYGREYTVGLLEEGLERPLKFADYPRCEGYILKTREKIDRAVAAGLKK